MAGKQQRDYGREKDAAETLPVRQAAETKTIPLLTPSRVNCQNKKLALGSLCSLLRRRRTDNEKKVIDIKKSNTHKRTHPDVKVEASIWSLTRCMQRGNLYM